MTDPRPKVIVIPPRICEECGFDESESYFQGYYFVMGRCVVGCVHHALCKGCADDLDVFADYDSREKIFGTCPDAARVARAVMKDGDA